MRYIVATDGSEESDDAVRYAAEHAAALDGTLEIVHVLEPDAEIVNGEIVLPGGDGATALGEQTLEAARELAQGVAEDYDTSLAVDTELLAGRPADALTNHAEVTGADAIYIGHRGLSEQRDLVVGSVAKSVVDKATIPVTVIR